MRSSAARRLFWLVFAFWFMPALVVPEMVDQCPVHHFVAGAQPHHAGHPGMGKSNSPLNHSSHHGCTCLDRGCCTANAATVPRTDLGVAANFRTITKIATINDDLIVVASTSLLLPPTTGPPPRA